MKQLQTDLSCFKLKSHSNKLLITHLKEVAYNIEHFLQEISFEDKQFTRDFAMIAAIAHDFGKATTFFQNKILKQEKNNLARHGFLSSLFAYFLARNLIKDHSEIKTIMPIITWLVVLRHHGNLRNFSYELNEVNPIVRAQSEVEDLYTQLQNIKEENIDEVVRIYACFGKEKEVREFLNLKKENLDGLLTEISEYRSFKIDEMLFYFYCLLMYSLLLDADKLSAADLEPVKRIENIDVAIIDDYKKMYLKKDSAPINQIRNKAFQEAKENLEGLSDGKILSVELPTGLGKTLIALNTALTIRKKLKSNYNILARIIYCLPFLSIIDQNSEVITDVLKIRFPIDEEKNTNLFLKHHHLIDVSYEELTANDQLSLDNAILLTENWSSEIVATTFEQLFYAIFTNKNSFARRFHNIINSIIVLDEIQTIPHKYWSLLKATLKILTEKFNCTIIFCTATMPLIFDSNELIPIINGNTYFSLMNRWNLIFDDREQELSNFLDELNKELESNSKDYLIVMNTINSSLKAYDFIKSKLIERGYHFDITPAGIAIDKKNRTALIYLSTNVVPLHRLERIKAIRAEKQYKELNNYRKIIVSTQLIEAGVDISADIVIRDFAPIDSLIQTTGRCNRNSTNPGLTKIVILKDKMEFCSYIYDSFLISNSKRILAKFAKKAEPESQFTKEIVNEYFKIIKEGQSTDHANEILSAIKDLDFEKINELFKLIENCEQINVFLEMDKNAAELLEQFKKIRRMQGFKKKNLIKKIKRQLGQTTIELKFAKMKNAKSVLSPLEETENFYYVPYNSLKDYYDIETGFKPTIISTII